MIPIESVIVLVVAGVLFTVGLTALSARANLIKMVMGIEFLGKGVSLIFILGGFLSGDVGDSQAVVFTLIAIEAVVAGVALAFVVVANRIWKTLDSSTIFRLSGGEER